MPIIKFTILDERFKTLSPLKPHFKPFDMDCLVVVVAFGMVFGISLAGEFLERDDTSLEPLSADALWGNTDIFSDVGWPDLEDSTLSFNDVGIVEGSDSDSFSASACDVGNDQMLPSKLRARDGGLCLNKDPVASWFNLPTIFGGKTQPATKQQEEQRLGPNQDGYYDKCSPSYRFNLCCEGDIWGPSGDFANVWERIENCYASMLFKILLLLQ